MIVKIYTEKYGPSSTFESYLEGRVEADIFHCLNYTIDESHVNFHNPLKGRRDLDHDVRPWLEIFNVITKGVVVASHVFINVFCFLF